jgi:fumarate reductase flavoprotein subunit
MNSANPDPVGADIVVVGGGVAGLTAANRGAQLGLKTILLEKGAEEKYLCNTRYTGGTFHVCMDDIMAGEATHLRAIERLCDGARPDLARVMAHNAERTVRWLRDEGCKFLKASASPHHRWVLAPPGRYALALIGKAAPATCCCAVSATA